MGLPTALCLLGILTCSFFLGAESRSCPNGWFQVRDYCYGYTDRRLTWADAEEDCQGNRRSAHLASIINMPETLVVSKYISSSQIYKGNVWIGLRDVNQTGDWEWSDKSSYKYHAWMEKHPDFSGNSGFCAQLTFTSGFVGWTDASCKKLNPFICKF